MRAVVLSGTAVFAIASSGNAQTVTLGPEGVTQSEGLGRAFQTFSIFGGTPGIAAARYYSNFDLNSFQLPIAHSFDPIEGGFLSGVAPYAEITLGYLTGSQVFPLTSDGNSPTSVKLSFNAWSALAGGGIDVPLGNGFKIRPIVLAGYSYVGGDAKFYGPNSVLARSQVSGILSDASLSSVLLGGALELIYESPLRGDMNLRAQARYNRARCAGNGGIEQRSTGQWQLRRGKRVCNSHRPDRLADCQQRRALAGVRQGHVASGNQSQPTGVQLVRRARRGTADHRAGRYPRCARSDSTRLCHRGAGRHRLAGQRRSELLIDSDVIRRTYRLLSLKKLPS